MQNTTKDQASHNYAKRPRTELVALLMGLAGHYKKRYCWPSQDKICELYEQRTGVHLSRRALNYQLGALEAQGWIKRTRRHRIEPGRGWAFRSTLYTFCQRATRYAAAAAVALAIFAGWPGPAWAKKPCAEVSAISVSLKQDDCRTPLPGVPGNRKKDSAAKFAAEARKILAR